MKNWTIAKRIVGLSALLIISLLVVGGLAVFSLQRIERTGTHKLKNEAIPGIVSISEVVNQVLRGHIRVLMVALDNTEDNRQDTMTRLTTSDRTLEESLAAYGRTITLESEHEKFNNLIALKSGYLEERNAALQLMNEGKSEEFKTAVLENLESAYVGYRNLAVSMLKFNQENAAAATNGVISEAEVATKRAIWLAVIAIAIALAAATVVVIGINRVLRQMAGTLDSAATQLSSAAGEVSSSSQSLAEGASEQAASLEETSASLEEVSSMIKRNAQNAQAMRELSTQSRHATEAGASGMTDMSNSMTGIRTAAVEMRTTMDSIKSASSDVGKIIKTIDEIAFQTNLLALNAAVEAARAGEAGMGFAVVADEVRNLAQRSAKAAKETADMIEASIKRSEQGAVVTEKVAAAIDTVAAKAIAVGDQLTDVLAKSRQIDDQVSQIATASHEQAQGISQVATAVTGMDKITQSNASGAEQSAAAAEELNAQSHALRETVEELRQLVGVSTRKKGSRREKGSVAGVEGALSAA